MIGSTMRIATSSRSRSFASCVAPRTFASVLYAFSVAIVYGRPIDARYSLISLRPPNASTNVAIEPRLVDRERRVDEDAVAVEALDVVPLVRAAVAEDVHAVLAHRADDRGRRHRAAERRRVEVLACPPVERWNAPHWTRDDPLAHQRVAAVDEARRSSRRARSRWAGCRDVRLVRLAEVGRVARRPRGPGAAARRRRCACRGRRRRRCRCGCRPGGACGGCGSWSRLTHSAETRERRRGR